MKKSSLSKPGTMCLILVVPMLLVGKLAAQCSGTLCGPNLIPNPSFELTTSVCATGGFLYTDTSPVQDWYGLASSTGAAANGTTPDNFNSNCYGNPTINCGGGDGSIGMFTVSARESVQAKLVTPLKAGHRYCFSMKVRSWPTGSMGTNDGIGAWFHDKGKIDIEAMNGGHQFLGVGSVMNATPQVQNPSGSMITNDCRIISGTFCAEGGESWVVLSNFRTDKDTKFSTVGYLIIDELSLKENNCVTVKITAAADSLCPGSCTALTANVTGGNGTYTYLWTPGGETTKSINVCPTANGTKYKCTVTSSAGCAATLSVTDSIAIYYKSYIPSPTITVTGTTTLCAGDSVTLTSSPSPNYLWSPGGKTTQSIKVGSSGLYTVMVKHPVSACNTTSASINVLVNTLPALNVSGLINEPSACDVNNGSLKGVTATGKPTLTYSWNSNPVQTTPDLINVGAGTYILTVTDGNGCTKTMSGTIINKSAPNPPVVKANTTEICTGGSTTMYVSGVDPTYTYTWTHNGIIISTNDTLFINNATLNDAGVYKITATKFGCTGAATDLTLTVKQTPDSVTVKATSAIICEGLKTLLYINPSDPSITYTWITPSKTTVINDSLIIDKAKLTDDGTYTVTATGKNMCTSVEVHPKLTVNAAAIHEKAVVSNAIICEGDTTTIAAANYIPGATYNIYTQSTGGTAIGVAPLKVSPVKTTVYYMEATSSKGCNQITERDTVTVTVYKAPNVPPPVASNTTICEGKTTIIDVLNPVAGNTYKVYDAPTGGKLLGSTPLTIAFTNTTTVYIEAISSQGCKQVTGRLPITIKVNPTPAGPKIAIDNITGNHICDGLSAKLTSSIASGIIWSTGATTPSIVVTKAGTYSVHYTDANGCASLDDSVRITIKTPPKVDASNYIIDTVLCNTTIGGIHGVMINNGTAPYVYKWFETSSPTKIVSTELVLQGVPSGNYTLIVTDKNGCEDQLKNIFIPTKGGIVAHLAGNPPNGGAPLNVDLKAGTSGVGKPIDYVWTLNGQVMGTTDSKTNTYPIKNLPFGEHVVSVTVRDSNGCKSVDYLKIYVHTAVHILDVNIFTPNNDGHNDVLKFPSVGVQSIHVKIYDRWGLKLFEWTDPEKGWDGNSGSNGEPVPEGTYYYLIDYVDYYGIPLQKSGYVQLMRN